MVDRLSGAIASVCATMILSVGFDASASLERGQVRTTFDPYGDSDDEDAQEETGAVGELSPKWAVIASYQITFRPEMLEPLRDGRAVRRRESEERLHLRTFGVDYRPFKYLFAGVSLPVVKSYYRRVAGDFEKVEFDGTGLGDLSTYLGTELPWFPLTLTGVLMWPTGNYEKGMGTGEFSGGLTADFSWTVGRFTPKVGAFYFLVKDPEDPEPGNPDVDAQELPNTYGWNVGVAMRVIDWLRAEARFDWSYVTLISGYSTHVSKPSIRLTWKLTDWLHAVIGFAAEVHPLKSYTPSIALVGSF